MHSTFHQAMAEIAYRIKILPSVDELNSLEHDLSNICDAYRQGLTPLQQQQVLNYAKKCLEKAKVDRLH